MFGRLVQNNGTIWYCNGDSWLDLAAQTPDMSAYVDLTSTQDIGGTKKFTNAVTLAQAVLPDIYTGTLNYVGVENGDLKFNEHTVYHAGNFTPADYAAITSTLTNRGEIPPGVDLNTYTATGIYHQNANAYAASGTNYPAAAAGMLTVYAYGPMVYQSYQRYNTGERWHRSCYNNVWSVWYKIVGTVDGLVPVATIWNANIGIRSTIADRALVFEQSDGIARMAIRYIRASGKLQVDSYDTAGTLITNPMTVSPIGAVEIQGTGAAYFFNDRGGARQWAWYSTGNVAYLWNDNVANVMGISQDGKFAIGGSTTDGTARMMVHSGLFGQQSAHIALAQSSVTLYRIGIDADRTFRLWRYNDNGTYRSNPFSILPNGLVYVQSDYGYVQIGPNNGTYCHFITDRSTFYFNREIHVGGEIKFYNGPRVPKIFVQSTDPGTAAVDGDLWIWTYTYRRLSGLWVKVVG